MKNKFSLEELVAMEQEAGNINILPPAEVTPNKSGRLSLDDMLAMESGGVAPLAPPVIPERSFIGGLIDSVKTREGDIELSELPPEDLQLGQLEAAQIAGQFMLEPTEEGRARIIKKFIPDAKFGMEDDNPFFTVGDKKVFLNKKGFSQQDIADIGGAIAMFSPAAKGAQALTKGAPLLTRAIGQGSAAGATSAIGQGISSELGNISDVDLGRVISEAGFASVGEAAFPILGGVAKKIFKNQSLTEQEIKSLSDIGIDPSQLSKENLLKITEGSNRIFGDAAQRLRKAEGEGLDIPVPQTTGDISQFGAQRILESRAATGQLGQKSKQIMQDFLEGQNQAIQQNINLMRSKLGMGVDITPAEAGAIVQRKLVNLKNIKGESVSQAYDDAFNNNIAIPKATPQVLQNRFASALERLFIDEQSIGGLPAVRRIVGKITPEGTDSLSGINQLEAVRKSINKNIIGTAGDNATQREAGRALIKELDSTIDDFIEGGLLGGDEAVISKLKAARKEYRDFKRIFDDNDIVDMLTAKEGVGKSSRLVVDSDDAINAIFNKGSINKKGVTGSIIKLKRVLPPQDFALLKQAGIDRIIGKKQVSGDVSAVTFRNNFENTMRDNPRLMRALYSKRELSDISNVTNILKRIEDKGLSGNTPAERKLLGNLMQSGQRMFTNALLSDVVNKVTSVITNVRLRDAVRGSFRGADITPAIIPPASIAIGRESQDE